MKTNTRKDFLGCLENKGMGRREAYPRSSFLSGNRNEPKKKEATSFRRLSCALLLRASVR